MTTWNYRLVRYLDDEERKLVLSEVYYDDAGNVKSYTEYSGRFIADATKEDVKKILEWCATALDKPVLEERMVDGKLHLVEVQDER